MHPLLRTLLVGAALAAPLLVPAALPQAQAAVNHVVISEFATRGPSAATDEFVELYNPTSGPVSLSGWKLQYKSASGTTWSDRAILPANATIPAHGFYLIVNTSYVGSVAADYSSGLWTSGTGMADSGHERLLDASSLEVDKVGYGTAIDPEGSPAPNHGTSANGNSVERKALATSTADSLAAGGAHRLLGNGQDTNSNAADFVFQSHGRDPQNSSNPPEPAFASGGNGTGRVSVSPAVVFTSRPDGPLQFGFEQDSSATISQVAITLPAAWTWSHSPGDVALSGPAFASATASVSGDTVLVSGAALTTADNGSITVLDVATPQAKGGFPFIVRTAVASGALTPVALQPSVRVLELAPIVTVHVNDASGVPVAPYAAGSEATVTGVVTASLSSVRTDVYVQDVTGGINIFNAAVLPDTLAPGDSVTVTGSILQFRGITELQPELALLTRHASGRPQPEPLLLTCAEVNATFRPDYTEPNESRLVRLDGVTYNSANSTITDATGTTAIFIPSSFPPTPAVFDLIGILKQYKPGTPAPGPPYTADYEIVPRTPDDIIAHPGPIILSTPYEDQLQPTAVRLNWTTDVPSSSIVRYGLSAALGDSVVDPAMVTQHSLVVPGLASATAYYYSAGSEDAFGANFTPNSLFSTSSPPQSTGQINVYFNKSVENQVAWYQAANANQNFPALLVPRLDNAKRSIDAALYSLSGAPGTALATALINARNRGVHVRVICEYDNSTSSGFTLLVNAGIPLINDHFDAINYGAGLMHNKFFVIDGRAGAPESTWVWTGSWNPTDPGTNNDFQNVIELQDQALANAYTLEFNEMWGSSTDTPNASASRFGARKLDNTPHRFLIGGRSVESYFSPSDGVNAQILATLNAAQHSIGFELLTLTRSDLAAALIARKAAGVAVRGDLDNGTDTGSEYNNLVNAGVDVKLKTGAPGLLHHKYVIVDAESPAYSAVTLTGSHNWSSAAENSNNENTLVVRDFNITNQYLQEFRARYHQFGGTDPIDVSVELTDPRAPRTVSLSQNFPNPSHGETAIDYAIPTSEHVELKLFDLQGRELQTLVRAEQAPGRYRVSFTTRNLAGGVYFYRLRVGGTVQQRKMLLLR